MDAEKKESQARKQSDKIEIRVEIYFDKDANGLITGQHKAVYLWDKLMYKEWTSADIHDNKVKVGSLLQPLEDSVVWMHCQRGKSIQYSRSNRGDFICRFKVFWRKVFGKLLNKHFK